MANPMYDASIKLLKAYVACKAGEHRQGFKLFAEAIKEEGIDPLMDGIANALKKIKAQDEEEDFEFDENGDAGDDEFEGDEEGDEEVDADSEEDDGEELEDDYDDEGIEENGDDSEDDEEIEIPASVVQVLKLKR